MEGTKNSAAKPQPKTVGALYERPFKFIGFAFAVDECAI
jgi:hypothetical protein